MAALGLLLHPKLLRSVNSQLPSDWCAPPRSHISSARRHLVFWDYSTPANKRHSKHDTGKEIRHYHFSCSVWFVCVFFLKSCAQNWERDSGAPAAPRYARDEPTNPPPPKKRTFLLFFLLQSHVETGGGNGRNRLLTVLRPLPQAPRWVPLLKFDFLSSGVNSVHQEPSGGLRSLESTSPSANQESLSRKRSGPLR